LAGERGNKSPTPNFGFPTARLDGDGSEIVHVMWLITCAWRDDTTSTGTTFALGCLAWQATTQKAKTFLRVGKHT
jgi:hypothetical protein